MDRESGNFRLGDTVSEDGKRVAPLNYEAADLTTHGVIVGMTGSGKTGLAIVTLEEALVAGVPVLILDPKGKDAENDDCHAVHSSGVGTGRRCLCQCRASSDRWREDLDVAAQALRSHR